MLHQFNIIIITFYRLTLNCLFVTIKEHAFYEYTNESCIIWLEMKNKMQERLKLNTVNKLQNLNNCNTAYSIYNNLKFNKFLFLSTVLKNNINFWQKQYYNDNYKILEIPFKCIIIFLTIINNKIIIIMIKIIV